MDAAKAKLDINDSPKAEQKQGKLIELFDKNDTPNKKGSHLICVSL